MQGQGDFKLSRKNMVSRCRTGLSELATRLRSMSRFAYLKRNRQKMKDSVDYDLSEVLLLEKELDAQLRDDYWTEDDNWEKLRTAVVSVLWNMRFKYEDVALFGTCFDDVAWVRQKCTRLTDMFIDH